MSAHNGDRQFASSHPRHIARSYDLPDFKWGRSEPLVEMHGIIKVFKVGGGEVTVLKGIDVQFQQGEFVSVVGRSGSGKSTLVNMLTGIDHPTRGTVRVGDTMIHKLSESRMSSWRGRNLGIVFQFFQLLPMLTLVENVMLPMDFCNLYSPGNREERALQLLGRVGLAEFAHQLPGAVSGGQQQSAAVARAMANDPPIIIADEPTGNLDSRTAEEVMELFEEMATQGKTLIMVTHDQNLAQRAGRILHISDGELLHHGGEQISPPSGKAVE
jgi:putative ABC transport system ATP-binding protein